MRSTSATAPPATKSSSLLKSSRKILSTTTPSSSSKHQSVKEKLLTKLSYKVADDEVLDAKEELEMIRWARLVGFVMANFNDFNYDMNEAGIKDFIFYDTYSLCKLKVIYTVSKICPKAGVFAPCTIAIYHKKGTNRTNISFPISSTG